MRQTLLTTLLILLFASCSQDAPRPDSALSQQENLTSRPIEAGKVRLMLDAGIGEAEQGARLSVLGEPGNFRDKTYPKFMGNTTYYDNQASRSSWAPGLSTHVFIFGLDATTNKYELEGYANLIWKVSNGLPTGKHQTLLSLRGDERIWKAGYSSDRSQVEISTQYGDWLTITQGKSYRLLAISDDGGFDVNKPNSTEYPDGKAPMFYFGKGGNSPLEDPSSLKRPYQLNEGEHTGLIPYVLELDLTATAPNTLSKTGATANGYLPAIFYPASPILEVTVAEATPFITQNGSEIALGDVGDIAIASSCLTQKFGYTITGVDEVGVKPTFSVALKRLEAEYLVDHPKSPLYGSTYERLKLGP